MTFDSDTEYMLQLDSSAGAVNYNTTLEYRVPLGQRTSGPAKKEYVSIAGGSGDSEDNVNSGIANFKERNPQISFLAYFSVLEKSNNSLQNAVNNGDFTASDLSRFNQPMIEDVDTANDNITVSGDQRDRFNVSKETPTIVITNSTGNDGIYNVGSVTYNSGNDNTTLSLATGDITDSTSDGKVMDGVKTVVEQKVWLEEIVFDGRIGEEYELRGQEFEQGINTGRNVVLRQAEIVRNSGNPFTGNGVIQTKEGFNIG